MVASLRLRRVAALATLMLVAVAAVPASGASDRFRDDNGHPGEKALEWLAAQGVIHGCDPPHDLRVCPDEPVTRAQAAKILVGLAQAMGVLEERRPGASDHFSDDDEVWGGAADSYINHLADLSIVHGCDPPHNRSFCPYDILRRGQITKMVVRTFGLEAPAGYRSPWTDTAPHYFHAAARVAAYHGLFDHSAGVFDGYEPVSRADFARVVVAVFEPELCQENPFSAARVASLESVYPGVDFTAYVHDLDTGCAYSMNSDHRQETASVFKVMVMGGVFLEAQDDDRHLSSRERTWLASMITESANSPVRDLWRSFGGAPWFGRQADRFDLDQTNVVGDHQPVWGRTTTSAYDQGKLLRKVLLGEDGVITPRFREVALDLMTSVVSSQTWGISAGVPSGWTVAQKNGFAGQTTNSVGVVYDEDMTADYVLVVLTFGWEDWRQGVTAVERVSEWAAGALAE